MRNVRDIALGIVALCGYVVTLVLVDRHTRAIVDGLHDVAEAIRRLVIIVEDEGANNETDGG